MLNFGENNDCEELAKGKEGPVYQSKLLKHNLLTLQMYVSVMLPEHPPNTYSEEPAKYKDNTHQHPPILTVRNQQKARARLV